MKQGYWEEQEIKRRKVVGAALFWTKNTSMQAGHYEKWLLEEYVCGRLFIDEVVQLLDESIERAKAERDLEGAGFK